MSHSQKPKQFRLKPWKRREISDAKRARGVLGTRADHAVWIKRTRPTFAIALDVAQDQKQHKLHWSPTQLIHAAINSHTPHKRNDKDIEWSNAIALLRSVRRRENVIQYMQKHGNDERRQMAYKRIQRRWYKANRPPKGNSGLCSCGWDHEIHQRTYADPHCPVPGHGYMRLPNDALTIVFHPCMQRLIKRTDWDQQTG
jgi:hypothetical protein